MTWRDIRAWRRLPTAALCRRHHPMNLRLLPDDELDGLGLGLALAVATDCFITWLRTPPSPAKEPLSGLPW